MTALVALIASVAALDSLNPSTVGPALVLAVGRRPRRDVALFAVGVFGVSTIGGLVLLLGPGRALLAHVAKPSPHTQHLVEAVTGAVILVAAVVLWALRTHIRIRMARSQGAGGRSSFVLGAGIMAFELPTAFPYFAGLIAVVESRRTVATELALVFLYNVLFVAPLLLVLVLVMVGGPRAELVAWRARSALDAHAPTLVPIALGAVGVALLLVGGLNR